MNSSGVIINTAGWIRGAGYEALKQAAGAFEGKFLKHDKAKNERSENCLQCLFRSIGHIDDLLSLF